MTHKRMRVSVVRAVPASVNAAGLPMHLGDPGEHQAVRDVRVHCRLLGGVSVLYAEDAAEAAGHGSVDRARLRQAAIQIPADSV